MMVNKITVVAKSKVSVCDGRLNDEDILRLDQDVLAFLGQAVTPRVSPVRGDKECS
ncbi:MAG: hypothetical protein ABL996_02740 [Micropepsaceae bacterium]